MKIENASSVAQPVDPNNAFTIAATGKAFKILSDGLYSDKIMAIIRELSCNAYDSHVAVGKPDLPFEIHLPTTTEKWFSVTDFGTGISDEDIFKIYTRYFASTKTGSNEFIGQLGLGSKSPFSYTREFKVRSRVNGVERTYRMYFDDTDTPRVESLYEKDCAAAGLPPSGLEVSFDVNDNDMRRFSDRAVDVLSWFKVTPTITGNTANLGINSIVSEMKADGWMIRRQKGYATIPPVALMGNVAYPIDPDKIENLSERDSGLLSMPVVMEFEIGDLEVSASRESLGYDKKTQANIIRRCQEVAASIHAHYDALLKTFETKWEARRFFDQVFGYGGDHRFQMRDLFKDATLTWKDGTVINSQYVKLDLTKVYSDSAHGYRVHTGSHGKAVLNRVHNDQLSAFEQMCNNKSIIVFNDCDRGGLNRIKHWTKTSLSDGNVTVYDKPDSVSWDDLRDMLGNPPVQLSSAMPAPVKARVANASMMRYDGSDYGRHRWNDVTIDMSNGGYWISTFKKEPISPTGLRVELKSILTCARNLKLIPSDAIVYAPKGTMRNKIAKTKGWVNIVDLLVQKVKAEWKPDLLDSMSTLLAWNDQLRKVGCSEIGYGEWKLRDTNGLMQRVIDTHAEVTVISSSLEHQRMSSLKNLASLLNLSLPSGNPNNEKLAILADVSRRYPMLRIMDYRQWRDNFHQIVEYVNMVDANYVFYALTDPALSPVEE